jgi:hypothetical protein
MPHIESPQDEIPLPDFINDIEDDLFSDYGNTSKYHKEKGPQCGACIHHELGMVGRVRAFL